MSAPHLRQFGRRSDFLLHWSERTGTRQAFVLDLKTAESHQLTDVAALDPATLTLSADERTCLFFDGPSLTEIVLGTLHPRELYKVPEGSVRTGITVSSDGSIFFAEGSKIMRANRVRTAAVADTKVPIDMLLARPRHTQLLYRAGSAFWLINNDGTAKRQLKTEPGETGEALWSPSGHSLIYLHNPDDPKQLVTVREYLPDDNTDRLIAKTSQFATVAPNSDASVFTGASRSKASAYVLILLRVTRRELTLCEHRASDPKMASPVFSPDSQSVFFVSDRHGKPAVYRVHIEKFVEQTGIEG